MILMNEKCGVYVEIKLLPIDVIYALLIAYRGTESLRKGPGRIRFSFFVVANTTEKKNLTSVLKVNQKSKRPQFPKKWAHRFEKNR